MSDLKKGTRVIPGLPKEKEPVSRLSLESDLTGMRNAVIFPLIGC